MSENIIKMRKANISSNSCVGCGVCEKNCPAISKRENGRINFFAFSVVLGIVVFSSCLVGCSGKNENTGFEYWNEDAKSLSELKEYVKDVTDKSSSHFIPEEDRIAVFDMDGTLYGELAPIYIEWLLYA